jgi:hypothetical protein
VLKEEIEQMIKGSWELFLFSKMINYDILIIGEIIWIRLELTKKYYS